MHLCALFPCDIWKLGTTPIPLHLYCGWCSIIKLALCSRDNDSGSAMEWMLSFPRMTTISHSVLNETCLDTTPFSAVSEADHSPPKHGAEQTYWLCLSLRDWCRHHYQPSAFPLSCVECVNSTTFCDIAHMLWITHQGEECGPWLFTGFASGPPESIYCYQVFIGIIRNEKKLFLEHFVILLVYLVCCKQIPKTG